MNILCPVFLEAATSTCDKMKKRSSLSRAVCLDIRNQLTYWIERLPPTSTFKLKTQSTALRDIIAKHGASALRKMFPWLRPFATALLGTKSPTARTTWSLQQETDCGAASLQVIKQQQQGSTTSCRDGGHPDYELFRIDDMLLSKEEEGECAICTLANPNKLKSDMLTRLFPLEGSLGAKFIEFILGLILLNQIYIAKYQAV